jgi:hypothetical protein
MTEQEKKSFLLNKPNVGLLIYQPGAGELQNFSSGAVLV